MVRLAQQPGVKLYSASSKGAFEDISARKNASILLKELKTTKSVKLAEVVKMSANS